MGRGAASTRSQGRVRFTWHPGPRHRRREPTGVEVTFTADKDGTIVVLEHSGWETSRPNGAQGRVGYDNGWPGVLERFKRVRRGPAAKASLLLSMPHKGRRGFASAAVSPRPRYQRGTKQRALPKNRSRSFSGITRSVGDVRRLGDLEARGRSRPGSRRPFPITSSAALAISSATAIMRRVQLVADAVARAPRRSRITSSAGRTERDVDRPLAPRPPERVRDRARATVSAGELAKPFARCGPQMRRDRPAAGRACPARARSTSRRPPRRR